MFITACSTGPFPWNENHVYYGERFNSLSHLSGLLLAVAGAVWLLAGTIHSGDGFHIAGAIIFSVAVITLYAASTLYHSTRTSPLKQMWERWDHCSIYLLIAGTVTPLVLRQSMDWSAWLALTVIWTLAGFGIFCEVRSNQGKAPSVWLYIGLGWAGVLSVLLDWNQLSQTSLLLLMAGALLYTAGTVFYRNTSNRRHAHGFWHLFVVGGTSCHFLSISAHLL